MNAGRVVFDLGGRPVTAGTTTRGRAAMVARVTETFAVALVGEPDTGWLVEAASAGAAATPLPCRRHCGIIKP